MDGTVRIWNLRTGQCRHTLAGHTSLVGLLGLSPSHLVSAAADSTLRIWDPDSGELRHTLAAHTGAITCFQHDEFKVLSGSDGTLKMWDVRDGSVVRDLLTGITGVWQVVFEGRWCVAASNRTEATVLDVWDFGEGEEGEGWVGEPAGGVYDDGSEDEEEEEEEDGEGGEEGDLDAMDQDLEPSEDVLEVDEPMNGVATTMTTTTTATSVGPDEMGQDMDLVTERLEGVEGSRWAPTRVGGPYRRSVANRPSGAGGTQLAAGSSSSSVAAALGSRRRLALTANTANLFANPGTGGGQHPRPGVLPPNDETPTRPRVRNHAARRR